MVDTRFSFITRKDGREFQVLLYEPDPETDELVPVDWDEEATAALVAASSEEAP
jgi:hypothetical protein